MKQYILYTADLEKLFNNLIHKGSKVVAPVLRNEKTVYETVKEYAEISNDFIQTSRSAKEVVFPRTEKLFGFQKDKNDVTVSDIRIEDFPDVVVWGVRPCDAAGFLPLNAIFNWDYNDKLFNSRMDKTTLIGFSCQRADENCFCTSVGGNPGNTLGSDILLTRLEGESYLAEIVTAKGVSFIPGSECNPGFKLFISILIQSFVLKVGEKFSPTSLLNANEGIQVKKNENSMNKIETRCIKIPDFKLVVFICGYTNIVIKIHRGLPPVYINCPD